MQRKILITIVTLMFVGGLVSFGFAATNIRINASIGETHQMNVTLNKVVDGGWTTISDLVGEGMDFGSLIKSAENIFKSNAYFVVDAPVTSNKTGWTITHTTADFKKDATNNLNNNTNVKFIKVNNTTSAETLIASAGYVSYTTSNGKIINEADLTGGRLRIYYSIASGSGDATGVSTITTSKPTGTYTGTVTLTLSP